MTNWNLADVFSAVARHRGILPALEDGTGRRSWAELERRTDALAQLLAELAPEPQSTVAVYLRNTAEHLETYVACFKAGLVPYNVNHRYRSAELHHLFADARTAVLVVAAEFADRVLDLGGDVPDRFAIVSVGNSPGAADYEAAIAQRLDRVDVAGLAARRGPDDLMLIYTGGTTGQPKGVMWRQHDLFEALVLSGQQALDLPPVRTVDDLVAGLPDQPPRGLSASPLMHSTGLLNQFMVLLAGGTCALLPGTRFDAGTLWRTVAAQRVTSLSIVGDAFAVPMLEWLDRYPGVLDLSPLRLIVSSGAAWSAEVQDGLLRHLPQITLYDAFGSSEGFGLGMSSRVAGEPRATAQFRLGPHVRVRTDDGRWLDLGEEGVGRTAVRGVLPLGYYRDPVKTAETFMVIDGERYSIAGDYVQLSADGTLRLLGRGSACINTGGEKVFAEEVEQVVRAHPAVRDAACVGVPHPRFGQAICALVELAPGATLDVSELTTFVRERLADYKAPRHLVVVDDVPRTASGKVDYPACRSLALEGAVGSASPSR